MERDVHGCPRRHLEGLHADEGEHEGLRIGGDAAEGVGTVDIGHGSNLRPLHEDGYAGHGIAVLIGDGTLDGRNLCECGTCDGCECNQEKKESFHLH